jgi:hypothetical protein
MGIESFSTTTISRTARSDAVGQSSHQFHAARPPRHRPAGNNSWARGIVGIVRSLCRRRTGTREVSPAAARRCLLSEGTNHA